jgi:hypothetical protein
MRVERFSDMCTLFMTRSFMHDLHNVSDSIQQKAFKIAQYIAEDPHPKDYGGELLPGFHEIWQLAVMDDYWMTVSFHSVEYPPEILYLLRLHHQNDIDQKALRIISRCVTLPAQEGNEQNINECTKPEQLSVLPSSTHSEDYHVVRLNSLQRMLTEYEEKQLFDHLRTNPMLKVYELRLNLAMEGFDPILTKVINILNIQGKVITKFPSSKTVPGYDFQVRMIFVSRLSNQKVIETLTLRTALPSNAFSLNRVIVTE